MFDISLGELAVIGAVALVVLGPEKLPKVARAAGVMLGRAQRLASDFRSELERDFHNAELTELGKKMAEEETLVRQELNAATAEVHQTFVEMEAARYGEGDPELDALEHQRGGGDWVDLEQQQVLEAKVADSLPEDVSAPSPVSPDAKAIRQPDLFTPPEPPVTENIWRDRR
jgi:sec-independent protein translocase protein TatB